MTLQEKYDLLKEGLEGIRTYLVTCTHTGEIVNAPVQLVAVQALLARVNGASVLEAATPLLAAMTEALSDAKGPPPYQR